MKVRGCPCRKDNKCDKNGYSMKFIRDNSMYLKQISIFSLNDDIKSNDLLIFSNILA